ncbi:MAG: CHAT domain-containing protein, partial [Candidatus Omnitrophica bacterium]|nr:CHAT domain-containing protein [Candidatus Omnitrophota bacterium]
MNVSESNSESLDDLLNNLRDIEQRIEESRIRGCVMFTDLSGYTAYLDRYGDVAGRRRVQSARECVSAAADRHNGRIIKGLGDGWMLLFESAQEAVLASVEMQRCVQFSQREEINPIKLKIGLDYGGILEDEDDIYGDVVNVSSRLTDLCKGDDIVISRSVFDHIDPYYQQRCSPKSEFAIRGKSNKASIYELDWRANAIPRSRGQRTEKLEIEILWNGNESRVSLRTKEDGSETLMSYETHELELETIESHSEEIQKLIRKANLQGSIGESLANLERRGKALFDLLFTAKVRQDIQKSASSYILLKLDDSCVHLPWELLHDGVDFLCCRFAVGRTVRTSQPIHELKRVPPTEKIHLLLISDPSGNLPAAAKEGEGLYDLCRHDTRVELELLRSRVTPEAVKGRLGEFDVVHYCGHADHFGDRPDESGWLMSGGNLTAKNVMELFKGATAAPLMVFNNACYGGSTEAWNKVTEHESFGFANAFLRAGCTHYIGAVSEILDPTGEDFSKYFYRHVVAG